MGLEPVPILPAEVTGLEPFNKAEVGLWSEVRVGLMQGVDNCLFRVVEACHMRFQLFYLYYRQQVHLSMSAIT